MVQSVVDQDLLVKAQLLDTVQQIGLVKSPQDLLNTLKETVVIREADRVAICLFEGTPAEPKAQAKIVAALEVHSGQVQQPNSIFSQEQLPIIWSEETPDTFLSENIHQDDQMNAEIRRLLSQLEIQALAALALRADDNHLGWLLIEYRAPHQYSSKEISYLEILAKQLAIILQNQYLLQEVNQRAEILQIERQGQNTLYQFTNELDQATSVDALVDTLAGFGQVIQADEFLIYLAEDIGLEHLHASKEIVAIQPIYKKIRRNVKEIVLIPDVARDSVWSEISVLFENFALNSVICIPLMLQQGRAQGFVLFTHDQPNGFRVDLLEQVRSIATQFSLALKNRLASEDAENAIHEAQVLVAASRMLTASVELEDVYKTMNQAFLSTGADKSLLGIYYLDENNQAAELELVDFAGPNIASNVVEAVVGTRQTIMELGMPFLLTSLETGRTITIDNLADDPKLNSAEKEGLLALDLAAVAIIPIYSKGLPLGFVVVGYEQPHQFSDREISLLLTIANQTTLVIEHAKQLAAAEQRARQIQTGAEISKTATTILNQESLMDRAVNLIRDGFDYYYVGLFLVDSKAQAAILHAGTGEAGVNQIAENHKLDLDASSMIGRCIVQKEACIEFDIGAGTRYFKNKHLPLTRSEMALPLISRGVVIGAISIQSVEPTAFSQDDIVTLQIMADQLANAISNSTLFQKTQQNAQELGVLLEINRDISASIEINDLLDIIVTRATSLVNGDEGMIMLHHDGYLTPTAVSGEFSDPNFKQGLLNLHIPVGEGIAGRAAQERQAIVLKLDASNDSERATNAPKRWGWFVAVPIQAEDQLIGVILIRRVDFSQPFTENEARLLESVALQAAIAVENANLLISIEQARTQTESLYQMSRRIAAANSAQEAAALTVELMPKAFFDRVLFALRDPSNDQGIFSVEIAGAWDNEMPVDSILQLRFVNTEFSFLNTIIDRDVILIDDVEQDPILDEKSRQVLMAAQAKSVALISVRVGQRVLGLVLAESRVERSLTEDDLIPLQAAVDQAGTTIDRIQKTESLELASQQYLTMIDNIPGAVFQEELVSDQFKLKFISDDIVDMTGYPLADFQNAQLSLIREIIHPDDQAKSNTDISTQIEERGAYQVNHRIVTASGNEKYVAIHGRATRGDDGKIRYIDSIMFDRTERQKLQEAIAQRAAQFEAIAQVSESTSAILDVDRLLAETVNLITERFGLYYAAIFLLDPDQEWAVLRAGSGDAGSRMLAENHRLRRDENSMVGWATYHNQARIALDAGEEAHRFDNPHLPLTRSEIALPLIARRNVIGALDVQSTKAYAFTEDDIATFQLMANQLANAIDNARLFEQRQQRLREQAAMAEVARVASSTLDSRQIFQTTVEEMVKLFSPDLCTIFIYDDTYNNLQVVANYPNQQAIKQLTPINEDWSLMEDLSSRKIIQTTDKQLTAIAGPDICQAAFFPIYVSDNFKGFMSVGYTEKMGLLDSDEMAVGETLANQVGDSLEKAELFFAIREREQSLTSLNEIGLIANSSLDLQDVLTQASQTLVEIFKVDHCLFVVTDQELNGRVVAEYPATGQVGHVFPHGKTQIEKEMRETGKPIYVADASVDPRATDDDSTRAANSHLKSLLVVPVFVRGQIVGTFGLNSITEARHFTSQEISLAESIANTLAVSISNSQLFEATQQNLQEANLLYQASQEMLAAHNEEELFSLFIKWAAKVEADTVSVNLMNGEGQERYITVRDIWSHSETAYQKGERYLLSDFFLAPLIIQPETFVLTKVETDPQLSEDIRAQLQALGVHSMLIIPIMVQRRAVGTVHITYKYQSKIFTTNQVRLFESLVRELTIIWQNLNLVASIELRLRRERIIREVTSKIHAASGVEQVLQTTITELSKAFDAPHGIVQLQTRSETQSLTANGRKTNKVDLKED